MAQRVIYIVRDSRLDDCCKIGSDSAWPKRLRQAQSHSPGGIDLVALWRFPEADVRHLRATESLARAGLAPRKDADGIEWVSVNAATAARHVSMALGREPDEVATPALGRPYDDWRSLTDAVSGVTYRRRLWLFEEQSAQRRIKVIHSIHFNGAFLYPFTWNPYRVRLVAAFETPDDRTGPGIHWTASNSDIVTLWANVLRRFGGTPDQRCCGWLPEGVPLAEVTSEIRMQGLRGYDLTGPKPDDVPVKDPSMSQSIPARAVPPQYRVLQCVEEAPRSSFSGLLRKLRPWKA